jgi:ABC-2 type transport system permease protein
MSQTLTGVRPLLEVSLKQDVRNIAPWVVLIAALSGSSVLAYPWVFPDPQSRAELATTIAANPAFGLLFGPARDLSTADGFNAWRAGALGAFFAGLMAILTVVRNSRALEDSGQAELVASGVLGRPGRLAVAVAIAWQASLLLGVLASVVTILLGGSPADSVTLAATFTASGFMFGGIAAVAAQLGSDARAASSLAVTALGVAFLVRGVVDSSQAPEWTIWLTPLGWTEEVRPASGNNWWPLLACLALAVTTAVVAGVLQDRRDYGMGVLPPRPGPARGGAIVNPWGLAFRLNRAAVIGWSLAFLVLGTVFGFLATTVGELVIQNPQIAAVLAAGGLTEAGIVFEFLVTIVKLVGIVAAVYGVQVVMRIYAEELDHRIDPLLGGALSRSRYLASNATVAVVGPTLALLLAGATIGTTASALEETVVAGEVVRQALATAPAVWVLTALALAVVGAEPRRRLVAWLAVVVSFALTILGPIFRLQDWVLGVSPFWHVPNINARAPDWSGLGYLGLVAVVFLAVAFVGFRRRDVG